MIESPSAATSSGDGAAGEEPRGRVDLTSESLWFVPLAIASRTAAPPA